VKGSLSGSVAVVCKENARGGAQDSSYTYSVLKRDLLGRPSEQDVKNELIRLKEGGEVIPWHFGSWHISLSLPSESRFVRLGLSLYAGKSDTPQRTTLVSQGETNSLGVTLFSFMVAQTPTALACGLWQRDPFRFLFLIDS